MGCEQTIGSKYKRKENTAHILRNGMMLHKKKEENDKAPVMEFSYCCRRLSKKGKKAASQNLA